MVSARINGSRPFSGSSSTEYRDRPRRSRSGARAGATGRATRPRAGGRANPAAATSTRGVAASTCARWPARSTTRSTSTGSGPSGRASSTSRATAARCWSPTTRRRSRRDAPVIMHGIETELGRPVYGLADYLFRALPVVGTLWARSGGVARASRQRVPAAARRGAARARVPRRHEGHRASATATATSCTASAAAASSRSRCARACRSSRSRWSAPRSRCRSCSRAGGSPALLNLPYFPITANMLAFGPLGLGVYFPAKFRLRVLAARALRRATRTRSATRAAA